MYNPQGRSAERQHILSPGMFNFACCTWSWHQLAFLSHRTTLGCRGSEIVQLSLALSDVQLSPVGQQSSHAGDEVFPLAPAWINLNWLGTAGERHRERDCVCSSGIQFMSLSESTFSDDHGGRKAEFPWVLGCMELLSPSCVTVLLGPAAPHIALM